MSKTDEEEAEPRSLGCWQGKRRVMVMVCPQLEQAALLPILSCTYHIYGRYQNIRGKEINKII